MDGSIYIYSPKRISGYFREIRVIERNLRSRPRESANVVTLIQGAANGFEPDAAACANDENGLHGEPYALAAKVPAGIACHIA
jgi:hypothetical protein